MDREGSSHARLLLPMRRRQPGQTTLQRLQGTIIGISPEPGEEVNAVQMLTIKVAGPWQEQSHLLHATVEMLVRCKH
jgi:beta-lactam-binding protein with PASTA domain